MRTAPDGSGEAVPAPATDTPPPPVAPEAPPPRPDPVPRGVRALLAFFALTGLGVGGWQLLAPRSFNDGFPGFGHHWVTAYPPYNEHLLRDVGQAGVAIGALALYALVTADRRLARATGIVAVIANVPHQVYHQATLGRLPSTADQVAQTVSLSLVTVLSLWLLVAAFRHDAPRRGRA